MALIIELEAGEQAQLAEAAYREGVSPAELARKFIMEHLPVPAPSVPDAENLALIALLRSWREEDVTEDEQELARRDADTETFLSNLTANRLNASCAGGIMPTRAVLLDTTPLGLVTQKTGKSMKADACRLWMETLLTNGIRVYVPETADYEVRRELVRSGEKAGLRRLNDLKVLARYLPLDTFVMHTAADLWAKARNSGVATADVHALDGDVIVAAQALSLGLALSDFVVATENTKHIARFVPADHWQNIVP